MADNPYLALVPEQPQNNSTTANPYDEIVADDMDQQAAAIRQSMSMGMDTKPEDQAQRMRLAKTTGLPVPVVAASQPAIEKKAKLDSIDYVKMVKDNPNLARWLKNPDNAALAHDDHENLAALEHIGNALKAGYHRAKAGLENTESFALNLQGLINSGYRAAGGHLPADNLKVTAEQAKHAAESDNEIVKQIEATRASLSRVPRVALSGLESLPGTAIALLTGLVTRNPAAGLATFGLPVFGNANQEALGQGLDPVSAATHGTRQALLETVSESLGFAPLMKLAKGKDGFVKLATEFFGKEMFGEQINTLGSDFEEWVTLPENAGKSFADYASGIVPHAIDTAIATAAGGGVTALTVGGLGKVAQQVGKRSKRAVVDNATEGVKAISAKQHMDEYVQAASESELKNLDKESFRQYVRHINPDENVKLSADDAATFFQGNPEAAQQLQENDPAVYAQLAVSAETGADVTIPLDAYLADLSDWHDQLSDIIKVGDNVLSFRDYKESADKLQNEIGAEAQKVIDQAGSGFNESLIRVGQTFRQSLKDSGRFSDDVIDKYATLAESITATMAQRTGMTPEEFAAKYNLIAATPEQKQIQARQMADYTDQLIYRVRSGTVPTDSEVYGQSLTEFLRDNGGLKDSGGELKARDFNKGTAKSFKKNIVRKDGNELDRAAELAHEAGFIPERDINTLLDALDTELQGTPVYSPQNTNSELEQVAIDAAGIQQTLAGKDISNMSNAEVQAVLGGGEFFQRPADFRQLDMSALPDSMNEVVNHTSLSSLQGKKGSKEHAEYLAAKNDGDVEAALNVVDRVLKPAVIENIRKQLDPNKPLYVVPVRQRESDSMNAIPVAYAGRMAEALDGSVVTSIVKTEGGKNTGKSQSDRLMDKHGYDGEVPDADGQYIIVDDNYTSGNTIVPLIELIQSQGGSVPVLSTLAISRYGKSFKPKQEKINKLTEQTGLTKNEINTIIGHDLENLTGTELQIILNTTRQGDGAAKLRGLFEIRGSGDVRGSQSLDQSSRRQSSSNSLNQSNRGSITFPSTDLTDGASLLTIMETADLSTVLHEMGHFYFEVMNHIATQPNAPADIVADMNTLLDWLGIDSLEAWNSMTVDERRAAHEQTAEAFERYLMEGKAPSSKLRELFRTLKAWMMTVYRAIAPGTHINDDVRGVFDRLIASEEEIALAQSEAAAVAMFKTPEDAGMTDEEYADYVKDQQRLTENAESNLASDMIHDMQWLDGARDKALKALQREQNAKRKAMREEVTAEVNALPVYQARSLLMKGTLPDGTLPDGIQAVKLSVDDLHAMYGTDESAIWRALPNAMKRKKGGVHPDVVAAWFGYESGDALVIDLAAAAKPRDIIKAETEKRLLERYGIIKNEDDLRIAAMAALHNKAHERMVGTEYKALNNMAGKRDRLTLQAVRDYAEETIGNMIVKDIKPSQFLMAERKAARASMEAFGKGDVQEAARQKRIQLIQRSLYTAANRAVKERDSAVRYLKGFERKSIRRKLEATYLDQVKALLAQYDFRQATQKEIRARTGLLEWMAREKEKTGVEPNIPAQVLSRAQHIHYTSVSMDELRALKTAVREIDYFGRFKKKLLDARKTMEIKAAVADTVSSMEQHNDIHDEDIPYAKGIMDKLSDASKKTGSALLAIEHLLRRLDGDKLGPLWRSVFMPISEATDRAFARKREAATHFRELIQSIYTKAERARFSGLGAKTYDITGVGKMTKEQLISVAMNWGNKEGRDRLLTGNKFTESQIEEMLSHLDEKDIQLMDAMWRYFDENLWPDLEKLEREAHGEAPEKVKPIAYKVDGVEVRGGYYPLKYDRERGERAKRIDDQMTLEDFTTGKATQAATKQGAVKERVEHVGSAVRTDLGVFAQGINDAIQDIEMRRAVIDVYRIISDKDFERTFKGAAGRHAYDQLLPWLKDAAVPPEPPQDGFSRFMAMTRHHTAIVAMGFSVKTAFVNLTGILQSLDATDVGKGRIMKWVGKLAYNPTAWKKQQDFIFARSNYMTDRANTLDRDVREQMNKMSVAGTLTPKSSTYFILITMSDKAVAIPTWMAAYEKAMSDNGNNEVEAVRFADHVVRTTQGGGREIDLSYVQRGVPGNRELFKAFTMFYSYFNTTLNRNIRAVDLLKRNGLKGTPEFIASIMFVNIIPAVLGAIMAGYGPDDDDDPFAWAAVESVKFGLGQVPIVRDVGSYIVNQMAGKYQYLPLRATPLEGSFQDMIVGPYRVASDLIDGEADEQTAKKAILSAGYWAGLPSRQIWRTSEHLMHVMDNQSDFSPVDLLMGEKHK